MAGMNSMSIPSELILEKPLVVGYILKMFPRFSETFILNEILELERQGVKVLIFSMKQPDEPTTQPDVQKVQARITVIPPLKGKALWEHIISHGTCLFRSPRRYFQTLRFARLRRAKTAWNKFLLTPFIVRKARAARVEHLHAHFASGPTRQAKFSSMMSGIPYSFTAHAKDLFWEGHQHGRNNKLKKRVRMSSFVITISEYNRRFILKQNFKVPNNRLVTIYNGLDLTKWPLLRPDGQPTAKQENTLPLILAVGRFVPKKGFYDLVKACSILMDHDIPFRCVIVGEGPEKGKIKDLIQSYGLKEHVHLPGPVPQDRLLQDFYPQASVLVQPSVVSPDGDRDGIPTVILEALAIGLPVIATEISGIGEAVIDGDTGIIIPPGETEALARSIENLLADPALAKRLAEGGRRMIEKRFNLERNVNLVIHLMKFSARGGERMTATKLRRKVGLKPLKETVEDRS